MVFFKMRQYVYFSIITYCCDSTIIERPDNDIQSKSALVEPMAATTLLLLQVMTMC